MNTKKIDNYNAIFDALNDAVFVHDLETGAILEVNKAMLAMYGYGLEEIAELTIGDLSANEPPYDQTNVLQRVRAALDSSQLFEWKAKKRTVKFSG